MEIKELRIGNYISPLGIGLTKVEGFCIWDNLIQSSNFAERDIEDFEPIPLTEDWLLIFGFEKDSQVNLFRLENKLGIIVYYPKTSVEKAKINFMLTNASFMINTIRYVHELQNLCFALTQKELETKNHPL